MNYIAKQREILSRWQKRKGQIFICFHPFNDLTNNITFVSSFAKNE